MEGSRHGHGQVYVQGGGHGHVPGHLNLTVPSEAVPSEAVPSEAVPSPAVPSPAVPLVASEWPP